MQHFKRISYFYLFILLSFHRELSSNLRLRKGRVIYFHDAAQVKCLRDRLILEESGREIISLTQPRISLQEIHPCHDWQNDEFRWQIAVQRTILGKTN